MPPNKDQQSRSEGSGWKVRDRSEIGLRFNSNQKRRTSGVSARSFQGQNRDRKQLSNAEHCWGETALNVDGPALPANEKVECENWIRKRNLTGEQRDGYSRAQRR